MECRGVLLDLDGTLVDSNDQHARAWVDAFVEAGYDVSYERARELVGMGGDLLVEAAVGLAPDSDASQRLRDRRKAIFKERYLGQVRRFPKVTELLARLRELGLPYVLATSSSPEDLEGLLAQGGLEELGEDATSAGDADESKPAPDIIEAAVERLGEPPETLILLGDTPYDVEAAARAGVRCVALRCGGWHDEGLRGAIAIYDSPAHLLAELDRSPLAASRRPDAEGARPSP